MTRAHLNHIGIAVQDLPGMKRLFAILGMQVESAEPVPDQGVTTHFVPLSLENGRGFVELLEATDPEGAVAAFLKKRGPGIHHLSFTVKKSELDPLCQRLRKEGYRLVYDTPRVGAHGMRINFIHPGSSGGVLIEIMEPKEYQR